MEVVDTLIGTNTVIVQCDNGQSFSFNRKSEDKLEVDKSKTPDVVWKDLEDQGFVLESQTDYPITIKRYAHDEATGRDYEEIAEELNLDEDSDIVKSIAGLTYEISFTIRVIDENTCEVTHIYDQKLEEPLRLN